MALTENNYVGNGSTVLYSFTFPYLKATDIKVQLDGVITTAYSLANATTVQFNAAPTNGTAIRIYRDTDDSALPATFYPGSTVRAKDLNDNFTQSSFINQEVKARFVDATGATMSGNLGFAAGKGIVFEGTTDDAFETTLNGGDPTADRTLSLPNVSGTLVSTGDTGTVSTAMVANSAVTTAKINDSAVTTAKLDSGAVTSAKIADGTIVTGDLADGAITSAKIADGTIATVDIGDSQITTAKIADANITTAKIADANVTTAKVADSAITSAKIADGTIVAADIAADAVITAKILDANVTTAKIADSNVTTAKIADGNVTTAKILDANVTTAKIADSNVTTAKIADSNVTTAKIADSNVTTAKIADSAVTAAKIADGVISTTKLTDGTVVTNAEHSALTPNDTSFFTTSASDARYFRQDSTETIFSGDTWSSSDSRIASTAAIDARIIDLVDDVGGFVPIANETSFPLTNPDINNPDGAGTIISIKEISTSRTPSSGIVTIANGAGTNTVTINGCGSTVLAAGFGVLVETTSTLHTYTFHRLVPKATEVTTVAGISSDVTTVATNSANVTAVASNAANVNTVAGSIDNVNNVGGSIANVNSVASNLNTVNDFAARYRVSSTDPTTSLDTGDLVFNTTNNELRVFNGTAWQGGVTATGNLVSKSGDTLTGPLGITAGTAALPSLFISGDPNTGVFSAGADQLSFTTGGTERISISAAGNVNIPGALTKGGSNVVTVGDTGTVTNTMLVGSIDKTKITGTAITATDIGTVTSTMIADGTLVNADINASAAIDKTKINGTAITAADTGSVTNTMLAGSIDKAKISGTAITAADTGTVTSAMIADGTIVNGDISATAGIAVSKLAANTISGVTLGGSLSSVTFNNGGAGGASGSTFNGSGALTVSYNSVGAPSATGANASGTWGINVTGTAGSISGFNNPTTSATGNTIVYRDGNGDIYGRYLFVQHLNQASTNNENPGVSQILVTNGSDNYARKASISHLASAVQSNAGGTWGINVSGTAAALSTASGSAPSYAARAWVNFNGTGTVAIRASGNVSSITDNGTGDYTVNFTNSIADADYAPAMICGFDTDSSSPNGHMAEISRDAAPTSSALRIDTMSVGGGVTQRDLARVNIVILR